MTSSQPISDPTPLNANIREVQAVCDKHGTYAAREFFPPFEGQRPIVSACPVCSAQALAERETRERRQEEDRQRQRVVNLLRRSMIPARFQDRSLDSFAATTIGQQRALKIARRFVDSFSAPESRGASLVLAGKPGTGKTHIACGIARKLIETQQKTAVFMSVLQALRHVKDTYRRDSDRSESDAIADLIEPDLLILDEVGAQIGSEHEKMLMFEIINERYQGCRSTLLISNLNADELGQFLGDRVTDRFRESGAIVAFDWESHRGKSAA